jgi:ATP-dependent DNA helicase RecG
VSELARLKGIGPKRLRALESSGLTTLRELVYHLPRSYSDRTRFHSLVGLEAGQEAYACVLVDDVTYLANRMVVTVSEGGETLDLVFFQGLQYLKGRFKAGQKLVVAGTVTFFRTLQIAHPEWEVLEKDVEPKPQGLLPRYPLTEAMSEARIEHKLLHAWAIEALTTFAFSDPLDAKLRNLASLGDEVSVLKRLHAPVSLSDAAEAMETVKLRELLPLFHTMELRRRLRTGWGTVYSRRPDLEIEFDKSLPFTRTQSQVQVSDAIANALQTPGQFIGLLQGDVGSGKTVVATRVALGVLAAGAQVAFMAPTEILAVQHMHTLTPWLTSLGFAPALLTGEVQGREREDLLGELRNGSRSVVVGTHALLSEGVVFKALGLAVIDEQHRFGVKQRETLAAKGGHPHVLYMSATPIPRTLAQTVYGDLEVFSITEKPPGRLPIKTRLVAQEKRKEMLGFLAAEVGKGNQVFWVVPRIGPQAAKDGSYPMPGEAGGDEREEARGVEEVTAGLRKHASQWQVEAVHGRLAAEKRAGILARFRAGEIQVLVATTVIEVGVDIPQANIMVIEGPDRFGLAQLHQLRGRTGRGQEQAWCFLLTPTQMPPETETRLRTFAGTEDGFVLAEMDLKQRGAGHLDGTVQSGFGSLRFADLIADKLLVDRARELVRGLD